MAKKKGKKRKPPDDSAKEALRRVRAIYERHVDSGDEFALNDVRGEAKKECKDFADGLYDHSIEYLVQKVDHAHTQPKRNQPDRDLYGMVGVYVLPSVRMLFDDAGQDGRDAADKPNESEAAEDSNERRVAKRHAMLQHAEEALSIKAKNLALVRAAYDREKDMIEALRPYWKPGMTKAQAIVAREADNGGMTSA